jgi:putative ABC transport system substrate-binding protein
MRRREFITLLGGAAAASSVWPLAARAQQPDRLRRVAVLAGTTEAEFRARYELFRDGLARLGWTPPRNLRIDYRWTDNKPALQETYARELVGFAPDVILAVPGPVAEALQRLTRTIPIVFVTATDPVEAGYVQSFAHPGSNMTGFTNFEASVNSKWLQLLKDVAPNVSRVAVLRLETFARARRDFVTVEAAARSFAVTPVDALVKDDAAEIERVIAAFAREPNGGLIVPPSNALFKHRTLIVTLADRHHLPTIYNDRLFVDAGGLMSYGADRLENLQRAADYVDRILRGAKPGDLPIDEASKFDFVVNLRTARQLGLTLPPLFLARADEVIE